MFFGKKSKDKVACLNCKANLDNKYNFCPFCGVSAIDEEKEMREFGMLGKSDVSEESLIKEGLMTSNLGITDKLIGSLVNSLLKNLDKQFRDFEKTEIKNHPNGIRIRIATPQQHKKQSENKMVKKSPTDDQLERMASLPRSSAKANIRRLSDKLIYEIHTPGVESPQDVFISRSESGFEIKAIGKNKVYVKSLPVNLPLKNLSLNDNKLFVEFKTHEEQQ